MKKLIKSVLVLNSFMLAAICFGQEAAQADEKSILSWIQENAVPIRHIEAGNDFDDLQPLKQILKDVKVVGLGEATHGTREFFQFKHRLFELLVKEMDYTVFAIESSYTACKAINDYVLYGIGDKEAVLTSQGYSPWDTEEHADLIDWMRNYNQSVTEEKKVRFYGLDVAYNERGRDIVMAFLKNHAPAKVPATDALFQKISVFDEKWAMWQDEIRDEAAKTLPQTQSLIQFLTENQNALVESTSIKEFEQILKYAKVMEQMVSAIINPPLRTRNMAKNLLDLMELMPDSKFIVSAHNNHKNFSDHHGNINMGHDLKAELGAAYYAICFETNQGSYQARIWLPDKRVMTDFKVGVFGPSPVGSLPDNLSKAKKGDYFLDLRRSLDDRIIEEFWKIPQIVHDVHWVYREIFSENLYEVNLQSSYDGILFIEKTSRARPTSNALKLASQGVGF
jgi:erythromycin esterase